MKSFINKILPFALALALLFAGCSDVTEDVGTSIEDIYDNSVTALNVGQADCTLIESEGQFCLIDAGFVDGDTDINTYLAGRGVEKIDVMILTHFHYDHTSNVLELMRNFDIGTLLIPDLSEANTPTNSFYQALIERGEKGRYTLKFAARGLEIPFGGGVIRVLADTNNSENLTGKNSKDSSRITNNTSICLSFTKGDFVMVATGDAEKDTEDMIIDKLPEDVDLFLAGHHGSSDANSPRLLNRLNPALVIISCGKDNDYGHPHKEVISALNERGILFFITNEEGNIIYDMDTGKVYTED